MPPTGSFGAPLFFYLLLCPQSTTNQVKKLGSTRFYVANTIKKRQLVKQDVYYNFSGWQSDPAFDRGGINEFYQNALQSFGVSPA